MDTNLQHEILALLQRDYGFKHKGNYLREGTCPTCGKRTLYTSYDHPWLLRCGRLNHCGAEFAVRDLYSALFENWSKRYQPTDKNPHASADAYLRLARGFDVQRMQGLYTQEQYWSAEKDLGTATVRFALEKGWWERLIDQPERFGKMKARFAPGMQVAGIGWYSPHTERLLNTASELWLVEGIFDALALEHHDLAAIATLSAQNFPEKVLDGIARRGARKPTLIWALDNDAGARKCTRHFVKRARTMGFTCKAALLHQPAGGKLDWNDLHLRVMAKDAEESTTEWHKAVDEARYQGAIFLAQNTYEKAALLYQRTKRTAFPVEFENEWHWFAIDRKRLAEAEEENGDGESTLERNLRIAAECKRILNCNPQVLYFQKSLISEENFYFFQIDFPKNKKPQVQCTFSGNQVASAIEFKKRLLGMAAGAVFTGTAHHLDYLIDEQTSDIKLIDTIDYVGYARNHSCWMLGNLAVQHGQCYRINKEEYFEFDKLYLKCVNKSIQLEISPDTQGYRTEWLEWIWQCFGVNGIIALAFWTGSLFAEHIRSQFKSFPFLEVTGEPGSGKTTLLTFLWKLLGRSDYEGFDPSKATVAGRSRAMGQVAAMPVVLLEADRSTPDRAHAKKFDWDELKDFFGGGNLRTHGVKNSGNDAYKPPFRGTIVIAQNAAVDASEAILTRIVKLHFKRPQVSTESRTAADNLNALPVEAVSHFIITACRAEKRFMETFATGFKQYEAVLRQDPQLRLERVIKNHAQMMALIDCLHLIIPLDNAMREACVIALQEMGQERQQAVSPDHPAVNVFWETYEYLEGLSDERVVNHSRKPDRIAINLNDFYATAMIYSQKVPELELLRKLLPHSRRYKFLGSNVSVCSALRAPDTCKTKTVKCWTFEAT